LLFFSLFMLIKLNN